MNQDGEAAREEPQTQLMQVIGLTAEQFEHLVAEIRRVPTQPVQVTTTATPATRRPKLREPDLFEGDRPRLRGWLVQLRLYFATLGWEVGHDEEKINYAKSLLRKDAEK